MLQTGNYVISKTTRYRQTPEKRTEKTPFVYSQCTTAAKPVIQNPIR